MLLATRELRRSRFGLRGHAEALKQLVGAAARLPLGNAVHRNRARRVIRAALYQTLPYDVGGLDLVFVARGQTTRCKSGEVKKAAEQLLKNAGLVK